MKDYNFIICGAGLSGMMLAYFITREFKDSSILIIEKNKGLVPFKRLWSYWINQQHPLEEIVEKSWRRFSIYTPTQYKGFDLKKYRFELIKSDNFFSFVKKHLLNYSVDYKFESVVKTSSMAKRGVVETLEGGCYQAEWVFDSTLDTSPQNLPFSLQGWGWEVDLEKSVFSENELVFQDFRLSLVDQVFFYLMPITSKKVFIDSVSFEMDESVNNSQSEGLELISNYLRKCWGVSEFKILSSKFERIPLKLNQHSRFPSDRVVNIGVRGGLLKPTTSYGFVPILNDTELIIRSLKEKRTVLSRGRRSIFNRLIDYAMYKAIKTDPNNLLSICSQTFERSLSVQGDLILGFLNEENSLLENIELLRSKDPRLFISTFFIV